MSSHICPVVRLGEPRQIAGADKIEVFDIVGSGPVICVKGDYKAGDLACFIPPESMVDASVPVFDFLKKHARKSDGWAKIKPIRLRGQLSIGILVSPMGMPEGSDCGKKYGVVTYEEHVKIEQPQPKVKSWVARLWGRFFGTRADKGLWPGIPVYDINQLYKMPQNLFADDELMFVTEKLHGTNARYVIGKTGKLWCGSRTMWRLYNESNVYGRAAIEGKFEAKLRRLAEPIVLWGEIVGPNIQKGFNYGLKDGAIEFRCFDMYHAVDRRFLDPNETNDICHWLGIARVPTLMIDSWSAVKERLLELASGNAFNVVYSSPGGVDHPREGIVVRPYKDVKEAHALDGGRCLLAGKVINPAYLEFREKPGMDENIIL